MVLVAVVGVEEAVLRVDVVGRGFLDVLGVVLVEVMGVVGVVKVELVVDVIGVI